MTIDNLGDWRIDTVASLAEPYGSIPAGTPVRLMSTAKHSRHKYLSFVTPSASALCLNVAINAAALAEGIRPRLLLTHMTTHEGERGSLVRDESIADLYYFFEQSMIAVVMSFQAIEILANSIIGRRATEKITVRRKGGLVKQFTPKEAERELSTEEKVGQALPSILAVPSPRGTRVWQSFKKLKDARDSTVHLKSNDIYTRNQVDRESLFFYFLNRDARYYPNEAIKVITHFFPKSRPRWLAHATEIAGRDSAIVRATSAL